MELPAGAPVDPAWDPQPTHLPGRVLARGAVDMVVRVAVLFDVDYWGIEELAWRRADGLGTGPGLVVTGPGQRELF